MSDFFIGEILVLALLCIVLLRPFFNRLQRIEGISIFPLIALLICLAIIAGNGLKISFIPVLLFSFFLFLSGLHRLVRLFLQLPTDWFSPASVVYAGVLLLVWIGVFAATVLFAPENGYLSEVPVHRTVFVQKASPGVWGTYTITAPVETSDKNDIPSVVIMTSDIASSAGSRNTSAWILAENGYTVVEADYRSTYDYTNFLLYYPLLRKFFFLSGKITGFPYIMTSKTEIDQVQFKELERLVEYVDTEYGSSVQVFAIAGGTGISPLQKMIEKNPTFFNGSVYITSTSSVPSLGVEGDSVVVMLDSGMMPSNAGSFSTLVLTGDNSLVPEMGELSADDVLAGVMLGSQRDSGRKIAEMTGRRLATWFAMRRYR